MCGKWSQTSAGIVQCSYDAERVKKTLVRSMGLNYMLRKYPRRAPLGRIIFGALWVYCVSLHQDKTKIVLCCALREKAFSFHTAAISSTQSFVFCFTVMIIDIKWLCFQMKTDVLKSAAENRERRSRLEQQSLLIKYITMTHFCLFANKVMQWWSWLRKVCGLFFYFLSIFSQVMSVIISGGSWSL